MIYNIWQHDYMNMHSLYMRTMNMLKFAQSSKVRFHPIKFNIESIISNSILYLYTSYVYMLLSSLYICAYYYLYPIYIYIYIYIYRIYKYHIHISDIYFHSMYIFINHIYVELFYNIIMYKFSINPVYFCVREVSNI